MSAPSASAPAQRVGQRGRRQGLGHGAGARRQLVEREHHARQQQQHDEQGVGRGQAHEGASRPARTSARPTNAATASTVAATSGTGSTSGRQPRARAVATSTTACTAITTSTATPLAATRRGRPSGVAPRRLSTPYDRSNPVPMARLAKAVASTASASVPGARKSTGVAVDRQHVDQREEHQHRHRDAERQQQRLAVARRVSRSSRTGAPSGSRRRLRAARASHRASAGPSAVRRP